MEDEEYEILPHERVEYLRKEVDRLKNNPLIKSSSPDKLVEAIEKLTKSINRLEDLFQSINNVLLDEYKKGDGPDQKLDKLMEQNQKIAEALLNIKQDSGELNGMEEYEDEKPQNIQRQHYVQQTNQQPVQQQATQISQNIQRQPKIFNLPNSNELPPSYNMTPGQTFGQARTDMNQNSSNFDNLDLPEPPNFDLNYPTPNDFPEMKNPPPSTPNQEPPKKKKKFLGLM